MPKALVTAAVLAAAALTGCGGNGDDKDTTTADALAAENAAAMCDTMRETYEVALEAFYVVYEDSIGNPTGEDLVTAQFLKEYNDDYYEIVQGDPSTVRATSC